MDSAISTAARALSVADPLTALKYVALRSDARALALRGIAMARRQCDPHRAGLRPRRDVSLFAELPDFHGTLLSWGLAGAKFTMRAAAASGQST